MKTKKRRGTRPARQQAASSSGRLAARLVPASPEDLLELRGTLNALAYRMHKDMAGLAPWEPDDLVQEVFLKAITKLDRFQGRSSLKTWVVSVAKRHLLTMARAAAIRPRPAGDAVLEVRQRVLDRDRQGELRDSTGDLLEWLASNPDEVARGWEVLNLLLWNHGNYPYVAFAMSFHTGEGWSEQRVRAVVRKIKETPQGRALCLALLDD